MQLNKRFLESYQVFKDEPRVQQLREDVVRYNRRLRDLGIRDHQVGNSSRLDMCAVKLNEHARSRRPERPVSERWDFSFTESCS